MYMRYLVIFIETETRAVDAGGWGKRKCRVSV